MTLHFATTSLRIGAGFLIWAVHFGAVYVYVALVCARGDPQAQWLGLSAMRVTIALMTFIAVGALMAAFRQSVRGRWRVEAQRAGQPFIAWLSAAITAYGLIAVLWSALPTLWVAACTP